MKRKKNSHGDLRGPKNAISVEVPGRVEPQPVTLFPAAVGAAISVDVGLESPWLPFCVP